MLKTKEKVQPVEGPEISIERDEVLEAIKSMKNGKAPGLSGLTIGMIKAMEKDGID